MFELKARCWLQIKKKHVLILLMEIFILYKCPVFIRQKYNRERWRVKGDGKCNKLGGSNFLLNGGGTKSKIAGNVATKNGTFGSRFYYTVTLMEPGISYPI